MNPARLRAFDLRSRLAGPFTLQLEAGACLAIMGPSGAGKSLLLRMLADLDAHEGEVWLDGAPRSGFAAPDWRRNVRYVAAEPGWWLDTVGDHFDTGAGDILERLGLPADIMARTVQRCSTGERQRLALARALVDQPRVLLLDEPTGALDADSTSRVETILREALRAGSAIVLVTHDRLQADRLGTRQGRLANGRLIQA